MKQRRCTCELVVEPAYWLAPLAAVFCRRICLWGESVAHCPTYSSIVLSCLVVVRCQRHSLGNAICLSVCYVAPFFFCETFFLVGKIFSFLREFRCSIRAIAAVTCAHFVRVLSRHFFRYFTFPDDVTSKYFDCCCVFIAFVERGKQIICMMSLFSCWPIVATFHK